jgi:group II intron reverse transcriptase/maturase
MEHKALSRLRTLERLNQNRDFVNDDLYRLLYCEELYVVAYQKMKSKPGNMTAGSDGETLDGFSPEWVTDIVKLLRSEQYEFKPVRRVNIPKPGKPGQTRPLGIPSIRDKLLQEAMRMILEAIYDSPESPYFMDCSHGFRPGRGCHSALKSYRDGWSGVNWFIEGDIKACFDSMDHHVITNLLRKKIKDERFIRLIWKLLRAGVMNEFWIPEDSLSGTPQGGIVSPILANVVLHELDRKVEEIRQRYEKGKRKRQNPEYQELFNARRRAFRKAKGEITEEVRELDKRMREIPSVLTEDPDFIRIKYLRYADDWIIGVSGPRDLAESIKQEIATFLDQELKLTLSLEKTKITHARSEKAQFLGYFLTIGAGGGRSQQVVVTHEIQDGDKTRRVKKRSTGWQPYLYAPTDKLVARLHSNGFCDANGYPTHKPAWSMFDDDQIVTKCSAINRGIINYYRPADNFVDLRRIQYILQYSCAKTLSNKHKRSLKETFTRHGKNLRIRKVNRKGKELVIEFNLNRDWSRKPNAFAVSTEKIDRVRMYERLRTRSKLGWPCVICGTYEDVQMHHVRHIRSLKRNRGRQRDKSGFTELMRKMNRKQVPVCRKHHLEIHQGKYDGISLGQLAYDPTKGPIS